MSDDRIRDIDYRRSAARERALFKDRKISLLNPEQERLDTLQQDMLPAIRQAEGNENYGILSIDTDNNAKAAQQSIRNNYIRWIQSGAQARGVPFVEFMSDRYAPIGAENDPKNQNVNWTPNVTDILEETGRGSDYTQRGVIANPARQRALYRRVKADGNYEAQSLGSDSEAMYSQ